MANKNDETTDSQTPAEKKESPVPVEKVGGLDSAKVTDPAPDTKVGEQAHTESVEDLLALESEPPLTSSEPANTPPPQPKPAAPDTQAANDSEDGEAGEPQTSWTCPACGKVKQYRSLMVRHYKQSHPDKSAELVAALPAMRTGRFEGKPNKPRPPSFSDIISNNPAEPVDYKAMSGVMFDMTTGVAAGLLGPEWMPREDSPGSNTSKERDAMISAIAVYLKAKEVKDIPPGLMLTIVAIAYAGPRLRAPSTKSKISMTWTWIRLKLTRKPKLKQL